MMRMPVDLNFWLDLFLNAIVFFMYLYMCMFLDLKSIVEKMTAASSEIWKVLRIKPDMMRNKELRLFEELCLFEMKRVVSIWNKGLHPFGRNVSFVFKSYVSRVI